MNAKRDSIRLALYLGAACLLVGMSSPRASADTITYILNIPGSGLCADPATCANPGPYGSVSVDVALPGGPAEFTVTMFEPYGIAGGGPAFAFNIDDGDVAGLALSNLTAGFDLGGIDKQFSSFGRFSVVLSGPPPAGHPPSRLEFEVNRSGGFSSAGLFASDGTFGASQFFGAHVIAPDGISGFAGGSEPGSPVPEPASLLLLGSGLLGLSMVWRARRRAQD